MYAIFNVPYVRDEIKRFSQRYADRMEEHPNILATNLMKEVKATRRLERRLETCIPDRIVILHTPYALQDFHKLSILLNVAQSDSL